MINNISYYLLKIFLSLPIFLYLCIPDMLFIMSVYLDVCLARQSVWLSGFLHGQLDGWLLGRQAGRLAG